MRGGRGPPRGGFANKQVRFADSPATEQKVDPFSRSSSPATINPFDTVAVTSSSSPLEQEDLASTPAQDQPRSYHHFPGPSQDQIDPCDNDGTTRSASEEPAAYSPPAPLGEEGGEGRDENVCELEKDMLLAFEEQEKSSAATSLSSPRPLRYSAEPLHPPIDQDRDRGERSHLRSADLGYGPRLHHLDQSGKELHDHEQEHEVVAGVMREEDDDNGNREREREQRGEKRRP